MTDLSPSRAWNTWDAGRYLEMSLRPRGIRVTPLLYAASTGRTSLIGPGDQVMLGTHATDGSEISARITHAGTVLDWSYAKSAADAFTGRWKTLKFGEWGLRFWVTLVLSSDDGAAFSFDEKSGRAWCAGEPAIAIRAERAPLLVTGHDSIADLRAELETKGYWYLASRAASAKVLALRFNLDEAPENCFSVSGGSKADETPPAPPLDEPRAAMRDVMGWNGIWDSVNRRPYITCSRNWDLKKFGGYGFWLNDTAINALLVAPFDLDQARENLAMVFAAQTADGNLPCIMTGNDQWLDRSQSPVISYVVWLIWKATGARDLLESAYAPLARNNAWWRTQRDGNGNGILEFGSSELGQGLYKGTKLAAKDESFMDNSPIHDEASWNPVSRTLDSEDVGLNCLACFDSEMLGHIATELGMPQEAEGHARDAAALRAKITGHFWDPVRNIFANRLWSGRFVRSLAPTSFYPLLCNAAMPEQKSHLLRALDDLSLFGGEYGLPSTARRDPAFHDNVYWRGRVWPILNWLVWSGLHRAGETDAARRLAEKGWALFQQSWSARRLCPENYNALSGEGLDQPDTDPFYSWSALLAYIRQEELAASVPASLAGLK
ncbi:hypothetical protein BH10PSE7_BH10PSE7_32090 [soil metagenome]